MHRTPISAAFRIAFAGTLLSVIPFVSGCGGQPSSEAAGPDQVYSPSPDARVIPTASTGKSPLLPAALPSKATKHAASPAGQPSPTKPIDEPQAKVESKPVTERLQADAASKGPTASDDETNRKQVVGKWLQQNEEKRTITVKDDGTATIVAELSDYRQYIVGNTLEFDVKWTLDAGKLTFITTGGRPAESIKYITALFGKSRVYQIIEFVDDQLMLKKDETGEDEPAWTRLAE